jgi:hypothetical protein
MAVSLNDLILWRDWLVAARMTGTRAVQDADGSRIEYRSDAEMARAIAAADAMIAAGQPVTTIRFSTSKGL